MLGEPCVAQRLVFGSHTAPRLDQYIVNDDRDDRVVRVALVSPFACVDPFGDSAREVAVATEEETTGEAIACDVSISVHEIAGVEVPVDASEKALEVV